MTKIAIIDTETVSMKGAVCEFGITTLKGDQQFVVESSLGSYVNPQTPISFEAMNVHHITEEDVEDAPLLGYILSDHSLDGYDYVVAHNISYEQAVLPEEYFSDNVRKLCTLALARKLYPVGEVESYKLGVLYYQWGVYNDKRLQGINVELHSAKFDTLVTGLVLEYMLLDNDITIDQAYDIVNDVTTCNFKKYKGIKWEEVIRTDYGYCEYQVVNQKWDNDEELTYVKGLLDQYKNIKDAQLKLCRFNKYAGVEWYKVCQQDKDYIKFLDGKGYLTESDKQGIIQSIKDNITLYSIASGDCDDYNYEGSWEETLGGDFY